MFDSEVDDILDKPKKQWTDEEVLRVFEYDIESIDEEPTGNNLKSGNGEWNVSRKLLDRAAGGINNALWLLGREPFTRFIVKSDTETGTSFNERTDLAQHELRSLEHELGRPPQKSEVKEKIHYGEDFRFDSGIPYYPLSQNLQGLIDPEREDELVEMLFVDQIDPAILKRNNETQWRDPEIQEAAAGYEISLVTETYIRWVDEISDIEEEKESPGDDEEIDFDGELSSMRTFQVFEHLGEGLAPKEIADEIDLSYSQVLNDVKKLKDQGLAFTTSVIGDQGAERRTVLTDEGERYFEEEEIEISTKTEPEFEGEFPEELHYSESKKLIRLLAEGYSTQQEMAEEFDVTPTGIQPYIQELKSYGFVDSKRGKGTWLTDEGEQFYNQHVENGSSPETVVDDGSDSASDFSDPRTSSKTDDLSEIPDILDSEEGQTVLELLGDDSSIQEIAEDIERSHAVAKRYIKRYEEEGLIERTRQEIDLTESGESLYRRIQG